ncbi:MAG: hypothetical protein IPM29_22810 [Planctomycetes bacterium]|nr:hypothetical protein [Planctomycetota bacterium]
MTILHTIAGALLCAGLAFGQQGTEPQHGQHQHGQAQPATQSAPAAATPGYTHKALYPLSVCVVSGEPLEGDDIEVFEAGGRTFRTCCGKCKAKVEADPAPYVAKLDAALIAVQAAAYPLKDCVISGKPLGSMGDPIQLVLDGTLVQLCCKGCIKRATNAAAEMATKVRDAAFAAQLASYPLTTCLISDHELGGEPVNVLYGTTLVRFCCDDCIGEFDKDPAKWLAKLQGARSAHAGAAGHDCGAACVPGASGGCCGSGGGATPVAQPQPAGGGDCCGTTSAPAATPKAGGGDCCGTTSAPAATPKAGGGDCCGTTSAPAATPKAGSGECCGTTAAPVATPAKKVD